MPPKWLKSSLHSSSWVDVLDHKRSAAMERWKTLVLSSGRLRLWGDLSWGWRAPEGLGLRGGSAGGRSAE